MDLKEISRKLNLLYDDLEQMEKDMEDLRSKIRIWEDQLNTAYDIENSKLAMLMDVPQ